MTFKFFDFCAGIGAGHSALASIGGECVGFSEINNDSEKTYRLLHNQPQDKLKNWGDLMKLNPDELPNFDMMIAGFPCQTFSIIGKRAGMEDKRGTIIYGLTEILKRKQVKYFLLENVKGLVNHDKGKTLKVIIELLDEAGYKVSWKVLRSSRFGVPQLRDRIYFVGVRKELVNETFKFQFPSEFETCNPLSNYLIENSDKFGFSESDYGWPTFIKYLNNKYNQGKYTVEYLSSLELQVIDTRQSDLRIYKNECPTLRTGRHGLLYVKNGKLRKLSGFESLLLQGFSEIEARSVEKINNTLLLSQAGNAFTVDVIKCVAKEMKTQLFDNNRIHKSVKTSKELNKLIFAHG